MGRKQRRRKGINNPAYSWCAQHQKKGYISKREAKRAARMYHPGEHLNVYQCTTDVGMWHIGHLPSAVVKRGVPREVVCKS